MLVKLTHQGRMLPFNLNGLIKHGHSTFVLDDCNAFDAGFWLDVSLLTHLVAELPH